MTHEDRIATLLAEMELRGLDVLIAFSNAAHHIEKPDAVFLLSGFKPLAPGFVLLRGDGEATLAVSPAWEGQRAEAASRTGHTLSTDDLAGALGGLLAGTAASRIGVAHLDTLAQELAAPVLALFDGEPARVDDVVFGAARVKTDDEIANAARATRIAEAGYARLLEIAEPGMPECRLALEIKSHMKSLDADDNFLMLTADAHPQAVQPSGERPLAKGDMILAEITPSYKGQFAQICRTAVLGEPTDLHREKYEIVVEAMNEGISRALPGAQMRAVCQGVDEVLSRYGYAEYCQPPYMNRRGHGLGTSCTVPGNVSLDNEIPLEAGMFFVVHPNQYIPEIGYCLCGEPVAVRDGAPEILAEAGAALGSIPIR